ncbi:MAG TPA: recombinase family protein [Candidatus Woesebacteria bacterium]|nr:recombinase family protein [Candidatus Woesebacteria bacterium]
MNYNTQDLFNIIKTLHNVQVGQDDLSNIKYVIYARKSTESEERQIRSLPDQIAECKQIVESRNLKLYSKVPIAESESAKEPDIRPKFREMLNDIKKGKYSGIIAWHPDRLARNMKEAGEIIDLIDKKIIRDLQFVTFTFQNNSSGLMLLGISFVLSKQYSDQLSDNVLRGIRRSIEEGKYLSAPKHGYYKDLNKYLRPDGDNFTLMKNAWKMRLENKSHKKIIEYLNTNRYSRPTDNSGENHEIFEVKEKRISEFFRDPFYAGVLLHGEKDKKIVNLTEVYDFIPMISVDEFLQINKMKSINKFFKSKFRIKEEGSVKADLLRGKIICGYCNVPMISAITHKNLKNRTAHYYNYRCDTERCKTPNRGLRAHIVVNYCINYLRKHRFNSKPAYNHYVKEMERVIKDQTETLETKKRVLIKARIDTDDKIGKIKGLLLNETDIQVKDTFKADLKTEQDNIKSINKELEQIKEEQKKQKQAILSYEKFLELFNDLPNIIIKTKSLKEKDYLLGKIFLNCIVKGKKVLSCGLNPPFDRFAESTKISSSRGGET